MSSPRKDRILIKGLGFHFEGEGGAAPLVAWIGVSVLTLTIVTAVLFPAVAGKVLAAPDRRGGVGVAGRTENLGGSSRSAGVKLNRDLTVVLQHLVHRMVTPR